MELNEQQKRNQEAFRIFANKEIIPYAEQFDREERIPPKLITKLAKHGYFGALLPEEYGGVGMDMITYGLLNEEIGRGCSSVRGLVMLQNMIAKSILRWGNKEQRDHWLNKISSGEVMAAFALTESEAGSDAQNVKTTITEKDDSYIINGHKKWITFGQLANLFLMVGQTEGRLCAFLLEKNTPGFSILPISGMLGLKATMLAELRMDNCQIPKENLVGGIGFGLVPVALTALNLGRYSVAWGSVGIAQACLEACIQLTRTRKQFDSYLKDHQLIQQMIADMIVNVKAGRLLCCQAGYLESLEDPNAIMEIMVAKYFASTMATQVANNAVQIHGALGYSNNSAVQRYLRDAKGMEIIEGTTQIHQINIAKFGYGLYGKI
jgi:alkylation response protein AidB-like acyl-CoA dehydrogenase